MTLATGDRVEIVYEGRTVEGEVVLASRNGRSLLLRFEALLGGYVGTMAVLDGGRGYRDLLRGLPVEVRRLSGPASR